jgi:hypothetical protein
MRKLIKINLIFAKTGFCLVAVALTPCLLVKIIGILGRTIPLFFSSSVVETIIFLLLLGGLFFSAISLFNFLIIIGIIIKKKNNRDKVLLKIFILSALGFATPFYLGFLSTDWNSPACVPWEEDCNRPVRGAKIISSMSGLRMEAEIYFGGNNSYSGFEEYSKKLDEARIIEKCALDDSFEINISPDGQQYCAKANLNNRTSEWYCIDSSLNSLRSNSTPKCSSNYYICD